MVKQLFAVQSPLQYLNALEAREAFAVDPATAHLAVFRGDPRAGSDWIAARAAADSWAAVHRNDVGFGFATVAPRRRRGEAIAAALGPVARTFVGDWRYDQMRHLARAVGAAEVVVLDDGVATHHTIAPARRNGDPPSLRRRVKSLVFGMAAGEPERLTFFSVYDVTAGPHDRVVPNRYHRLRRRAAGRAVSGEAWILGGPYVELGWMSEADRMRCVASLLSRAGGGDVVYRPHRREDRHRVARLADRFGLRVRRSDEPVELAAVRAPPAAVATVVSSALDTLAVIFDGRPGPALTALRPPDRVWRGAAAARRAGCVFRVYERQRAGRVAVVEP